MRILICHASGAQAGVLDQKVKTALPTARTHRVASLTEAYNVTEHRVPDVLLLAAQLASSPDAELLFALVKVMGVRCILIQEGKGRDAVDLPADMVSIPTDVNAADLAAILNATGPSPRPQIGSLPTHHIPLRQFSPNALVLIGASTGGIDALIRILRHWTTEAPPCLIVQHTGSNHMESLKRLLDGVTQATVTIAKDAERLSSGTIYLAPGKGTHLCIDSRKPMRTRLVAAPPVSGHCPSIDMLFHSAIGHGPNVIAALLTGMGRDGAQGLSALRNAGAMTFGQDQETCIVYGMPRIAKELGGVARELPIDRIGPALLESARKSSSAA